MFLFRQHFCIFLVGGVVVVLEGGTFLDPFWSQSLRAPRADRRLCRKHSRLNESGSFKNRP